MRINQRILPITGLAVVVLFSAMTRAAGVVMHHKDPNLAAAFTLPNQEGKEVSLSDFKGKIVVLEWMNYDCPFTKAEYKAGVMKQTAEKFAKQGVIWLAINSTNYADAKGDEAFIKEYQLSYPVLLDKDGKVGKWYGAKTTPDMFIIDTQGKIVYRGAIDNAPLAKKPEKEAYVNYVEKALNELQAGKSVSMPLTKPYGCSVKYNEPEKPKTNASAVQPKARRNNAAGYGYGRGYY
jgi:peroxiredoxin